MPRGKVARGRGGARGGGARGGGARGGRGGGGRGGNSVSRDLSGRVARPTLKELPPHLIVSPSNLPLPTILNESLPEFRNAQCFFSSLERICPEYTNSVTGHAHCWLGESLANLTRTPGTAFNADVVLEDGVSRPVFVKRIHLLDPLNAMEGEYIWPRDGALPAPSEPWRNALTKINDPYNEAYVDALFAAAASRLVASGTSPHWCRFYGTFSARVERYMFNISDVYDSIRHKPWWRRNQRNGLFKVYDPAKDDSVEPSPVFAETGNDLADDDFESMEDTAIQHAGASELVNESEPELAREESVQLSTPKLRMSRLSGSSSSGDTSGSEECTDDDETDEEEEEERYAEFIDFPVQVTLLERAEGTLDELLDAEEDDPSLEATRDARWTAWLWQIISALASAQHIYGFVHNDLHTNNIMWTTTSEDYLYYRVHKGKTSWIMKVPTYGRIMKIIDFGRATFTLPEPGGFFISDAFFPGNDAAEQYNCEPFYDDAYGSKVEPNPSFDLCRLAVSLLESLYPERPDAAKPVRTMSREGAKIYTETVSSVYNLLWAWLQDDNGKNVLRSPDGEERYPDFDLYKAIAAEVHGAVPCRQFERPLFTGYRCEVTPSGMPVYDLHIL